MATAKYLHLLSDFRFPSQSCFKMYYNVQFQCNSTTCRAVYILKVLKNFKIPNKIQNDEHTNDHNVLYNVLLQHYKAEKLLLKSMERLDIVHSVFENRLLPFLPSYSW